MIASFTTGPGATTLPIRIYSEVRLGVKPEINAICTIVLAVVALAVVAASFAAKLGDTAPSLAARAGRAQQVSYKPHRQDDKHAEEDVGQRPTQSTLGEFHQVLLREPRMAC